MNEVSKELQMKHTLTLTTSLPTILFTTLQLTDDIVRGMSPGGLSKSQVSARVGAFSI